MLANETLSIQRPLTERRPTPEVDLSLSEAALPARAPGLAKKVDIIRFEEGTKEILSLAKSLGRMQDRRSDGSLAGMLERRLDEELRSMSDLQRRYPDLPGSLEELKIKAFENGLREKLAADSAAVTISSHLRGLSVGYRAISRVLEGKSPDDLRLIQAAFEDRYGVSLRAALRESFAKILGTPWSRAGRDPELKLSRLLNLLNGDNAKAAADGLALALRSKDAGEAARILTQLSSRPEQLSTTRKTFDDVHAAASGARGLDEAVARRFRGIDRDLIEAACAGRTLEMEALTLERLISGKRPNLKEACNLLSSKSAEEVARIGETLGARAGGDVGDIVANLKVSRPDPRLDRLRALLEGDRLAADTALIRAGMTRLQGEWVGEAFIGKSVDERRALIASYEEIYDRKFWPDMKACVGKGTPLYLMGRLVKNGKLSAAELLRDCMHGLGTDEKGIKRLLAGKSSEEIAAIEKEYAKFRRYSFIQRYHLKPILLAKSLIETALESDRQGSFGDSLKRKTFVERDLRADLENELGGEDMRDVRCLLRGRPETLCDRFERLSARHAYERGGLLHRVVDLFSREGGAIDRDLASAREHHERYIKGRTPSMTETKRFETLLGYLENGVDSFRITKNTLAYVGANFVSCGTATVATLAALAMNESLVLAMIATGLGSMAGRVLIRWGLTAKGYGREQLAADAALSTVDGLTLAAGKVARAFGPVGRRLAASPIGKRVLRSAMSFALKSTIKSAQSLEEGKVSMHLEYASRAEDPNRGKEDDFDLNDFLRKLSIYA